LTDNQLARASGGDGFKSAIAYLAGVFSVSEDAIWSSLREELFATTVFGYKFRRTGRRNVDVLVPGGHASFVPYGALSSSEVHLAFLEIALRFVLAISRSEHWFLILDSGFLGALDSKRKAYVFTTLVKLRAPDLQTMFCLAREGDVQVLLSAESDKWIGATRIGRLTLHSFL
jgi:hypothetical protein